MGVFILKGVCVCCGRGLSQHVELAEVCVDESSLLEHLPHVLKDLQVELASLGLGQRGVLQQRSRSDRSIHEGAINEGQKSCNQSA